MLYMECYPAIKKNEILPFVAKWLDLENILFSEISQVEKDKFCMISLIDGILKIKQMNVYVKLKQTHRHRKLVAANGEREVGRDKLGVWD